MCQNRLIFEEHNQRLINVSTESGKIDKKTNQLDFQIKYIEVSIYPQKQFQITPLIHQTRKIILCTYFVNCLMVVDSLRCLETTSFTTETCRPGGIKPRDFLPILTRPPGSRISQSVRFRCAPGFRHLNKNTNKRTRQVIENLEK